MSLDVLLELRFMATMVTVMAFPITMPEMGMMYCEVNGKTLSRRSRIMVVPVPTRMDTKAMCFPRLPAV